MQKFDMEQTLFDLGDALDKLNHLSDRFISGYKLNSTKEMNELERNFFAANKNDMYIDMRIICDYIDAAEKAFKELEEGASV